MFILITVVAYILSIVFEAKKTRWWSILPTALSLAYSIGVEAKVLSFWIIFSIFLNLLFGGIIFAYIASRWIKRYEKNLELNTFFEWMERNMGEGDERNYDKAQFTNNRTNVLELLDKKLEYSLISKRRMRKIQKMRDDLGIIVTYKRAHKYMIDFNKDYSKWLVY